MTSEIGTCLVKTIIRKIKPNFLTLRSEKKSQKYRVPNTNTRLDNTVEIRKILAFLKSVKIKYQSLHSFFSII